MRSSSITSPLNRGLILFLLIISPTILATPIPTPIPQPASSTEPSTSEWFITRRLALPSISSTSQVLSFTKRHPHEIQTLHHLTRRGSVFEGRKGITIGFAIIIVVGVVVGLAVGSIAVFGFEWRRFFGKNSVRVRKERESLMGTPWAESSHPHPHHHPQAERREAQIPRIS
ncbi:hypothetical protein QBC43DRAFT_297920 [Cladorrhinum sp. PSN259]|nr:hypothetical protein QBC43DRAFT_297920 [Cladorrhinum sp. PSN259]